MYKRIMALLCSFTLLGSFAVAEYANAAVIQPVSPAYSYTYSCSSDLYASGSTITCESTLCGYSGTTTKIEVFQTLQMLNSYGTWNDMCHWRDTSYTFYASVTNNRYSSANGTYRLRTIFTVYSGTNYETITKYSNNKTLQIPNND